MNAFRRDLAYACLRLRQAPGFTAVAVVTLALGVGATTAVFGVVDPLLLQKLPVRQPDQLVLLHSAGTLYTIDISERAAFERYSAAVDALDGVIADAGLVEFQISYRGRRATALGEVVSSNYFAVLGVPAHVGRLPTPDDDQARNPVIALGYSYWARAFNADPSIIGETLVVNGRPQTIVGVAREGFFGITVGTAPDFYAPFGTGLQNPSWVKVVARLRTGLSLEQAGSALAPVFHQIAAASGLPEVEREQDMGRLLVTPAGRGLSEVRASLSTPAWVLSAVVALVLLVASANVAGLTLNRAIGRRHEMAVQVALGATTGRLVRQLVLEGAMVASMGTAAGVVSAHWAKPALLAWLSIGQPRPIALASDSSARVLLFSVAILCLTVLVCGVLPALAWARVDVAQSLRFRTAGLERGARVSGLRQVLVIAQIGASVTLLAGTGLLVHSVVNLNTFDVGFDPGRVLAISLTDSVASRPAGHGDQLLRELIERARRLPGVQAASFAALPPLTDREIGINVIAESSGRRLRYTRSSRR